MMGINDMYCIVISTTILVVLSRINMFNTKDLAEFMCRHYQYLSSFGLVAAE